MIDLAIDMLLIVGIAFCWHRIGACQFDEESSEIEKDMHGNGAHGPHRASRRCWWSRLKR
jgi:hypothetical protein